MAASRPHAKNLTKKSTTKSKKKISSIQHQEKESMMTDDFTLDDVLKLGGDKADYELLKSLEGEEEEEIVVKEKQECEDDTIPQDELMNFIKKLEFEKHNSKSDNDGNLNKNIKSTDKVSKEAIAKPTENRKKSEQVSGDVGKGEGVSGQRKKVKNKFKIQHEEISSSSDHACKKRNYMLLSDGSWLNQKYKGDVSATLKPTSQVLSQLKDQASGLFENELEIYKEKKMRDKSGNAQWITTVLKGGTLQDKVAALTLKFQDDPLHNLSALDTLIAMVKKKGRRELIIAIDTLKEIFLSDVLPDDSKLKTFDEQPLADLGRLAQGNKDQRDKLLMLWWFEAQLKKRYSEFLQALQIASHDTVIASVVKSLSTMHDLLSNKAEQENVLLPMIVGKIGDSKNKIAAKSSHHLLQLVSKHPNMKNVIVSEVERLLYKSKTAGKAQYYAVCFLNQIILSDDEEDLAAHLIEIYFTFFKNHVTKKDIDSKMMSALLIGVNRAFPYAKGITEKGKIIESINLIYKVVHIVDFNTSVQALQLIFLVMESQDNMSDRFYVALYKKLIDPSLQQSSKIAIFLNLLYKSMLKDNSDKRVKAFIKRLLQVCAHQSPTFTCGVLILVSEVIHKNSNILKLSHREEDDSDSEEEEHFKDINDEGTNEINSDEHQAQNKEKQKSAASSWVHRQNLKTVGTKTISTHYDICHRNPMYCCADSEIIWELEKLKHNFHPTVALFTQNILELKRVFYTGDPLKDFTLSKFLDRFVFRNPKKKEQVYKTVQSKNTRSYLAEDPKNIAIDSVEYLSLGEKKVPVDEKFTYRFIQNRSGNRPRPNDENDDQESDDESIDDDEFDKYLDDYEDGFEDSHKDIFGVYDADFASDFDKHQSKSKQDRGSDDDDDLSEEEPDFGDDMQDEFNSDSDNDKDADMEGADEDNLDFKEEDISFSDDDGEEEPMIKSKSIKKRKVSDVIFSNMKPMKKSKKFASENIFASADEFSHVLEEDVENAIDLGGTEAVSTTKNKAGAKQLKWEMERDRWIHEKDWKSLKRRGKANPKKNKNIGQKKNTNNVKTKKKKVPTATLR